MARCIAYQLVYKCFIRGTTYGRGVCRSRLESDSLPPSSFSRSESSSSSVSKLDVLESSGNPMRDVPGEAVCACGACEPGRAADVEILRGRGVVANIVLISGLSGLRTGSFCGSCAGCFFAFERELRLPHGRVGESLRDEDALTLSKARCRALPNTAFASFGLCGSRSSSPKTSRS